MALRAARRAAFLGASLLPLVDIGWIITPGHAGTGGDASLQVAVLALATKVIGFAGAALCLAALVRAGRRTASIGRAAVRITVVCLVGMLAMLGTAGVLTISNLTAVRATVGPPQPTLLWLASVAAMAAFTLSTLAALRLALPRRDGRATPTA